jgi:hypothetical protein
MIEPRYWTAFVLAAFAALAFGLAAAGSFWLIFAACPFVVCALMCIAPRAWLSNDAYRRTRNALAYACIIPAGIALAASIGVITFAVLALPPLCAFVFVAWRTKQPAAK